MKNSKPAERPLKLAMALIDLHDFILAYQKNPLLEIDLDSCLAILEENRVELFSLFHQRSITNFQHQKLKSLVDRIEDGLANIQNNIY